MVYLEFGRKILAAVIHHLVDILMVRQECVIAEFKPYEMIDHQAARQAKCQTKNINERETFISHQVADGDQKIVS
jgi:hypothetical protein